MIDFIFYIFGIICFLILLKDSTNPFIVDILLSIFWPIEVSIYKSDEKAYYQLYHTDFSSKRYRFFSLPTPFACCYSLSYDF